MPETSPTREDLTDPERVKLSFACACCTIEILKHAASTHTLDMVVQGSDACPDHNIPNWQDIVDQYIPPV